MRDRGNYTAQAKCPYFCGESKKSRGVMCSGLERGQTLRLYFRSEKRREIWLQEKCCSWNFGACPLQKVIGQAEAESDGQ